MTVLLATASLAQVNGLVEDNVQWSFVLEKTPFVPAIDVGVLADIFTVELNQARPSTLSVANYISPQCSRASGGIGWKVYDITAHLDGSPHGSPVGVAATTLGAGDGSQSLPSEVATVVTLRGLGAEDAPVEAPDGADPGAAVDRPRQRLSGRWYLGPLSQAAHDSPALQVSRPKAAFRSDVAAFLVDLRATWFAAGFVWSQWSRVNASIAVIQNVEIDDAWDTVRKRGQDATVRVVTDVTP